MGVIRVEPVKETKRAWDFVNDPKVITNLILGKLNRQPLFLKYSIPPAEFSPSETKGDGIVFYYNPSLVLPGEIILYLHVKKQLEFHFEPVEQVSQGVVVLRPTKLLVSKVERRFQRYEVSGDELVTSNFRVSRNKITTNNIQFQITSRVIFPQIAKKYASQFPDLKILIANSEDLPASVKEKEINQPEVISEGSRNIFVFPIVTYQKNKFLPLAYILFPFSFSLDEEKKTKILVELEKIADETYEKILEVNTVLIKSKQRVLNISEGGIAIEITDPELIKLIPYQETITFDINFKLVAPIRMQGEIKYIHKIHKEGETSLIIGVDFTGQGYTEFRRKNKDLLRNLIKKLSPV